MINFPADLGKLIILIDDHLRLTGSIQSHSLHLSPERSTATLRLEFSGAASPADLREEVTLELCGRLLPNALACRLARLSRSGRHVVVSVNLQDVQPAARVQKKLPPPAECQHYLESHADDLCLVLTRGSLMEPHELAPRCKDALRLLFSESARVQPAQICHELARTLGALLAEADEHPLLWPDHIRQKAADLLDQLNRLFA